jgi:hypothetical protein
MNSPSLGEKVVETKRENMFDSILCCIHISIMYTKIIGHRYMFWCIWCVHLMYFKKLCQKFYNWISKKIPWFSYIVIIDMSSIPSFVHINWIEFKILKIWKLDFVTSFFIHPIGIWIIVSSCHMNSWHLISQCKFQELWQDNYLRYESGKRKCNLIFHENPKVVG